MTEPLRCPHCHKRVADQNALYQHTKIKHGGPVKHGKVFRQPRDDGEQSVASELVVAIQSCDRPEYLAVMFPEAFHG